MGTALEYLLLRLLAFCKIRWASSSSSLVNFPNRLMYKLGVQKHFC
ncbi:hypothetical protein Lalb_Chr10g0096931 [Lupinus albus]|uniref:Uncharacterized protein n=1 Tax=Lupinus albus TaxID=3870 RepID=A0A6A4PUN1_LUPAL|nr:hypothetical protein Lalb_Chr10g0096931 [Lupinus albus]